MAKLNREQAFALAGEKGIPLKEKYAQGANTFYQARWVVLTIVLLAMF